MTRSIEHLTLALTAFAEHRTPARIAAAIKADGLDGLRRTYTSMPTSVRDQLADKAQALRDRGVGVLIAGDSDYPANLMAGIKPIAPVLFYSGNESLFHRAGVGMCGSRNVSEKGLEAAERCGFAVSRRQLTIVSGYAKGVDTATHLAALESGGSTVIVLAEGIDHFRVKREFKSVFSTDRTLVVSQFAPEQRWSVQNAMARNAIIFGLGEALIVIEAGEKGGTLAAGQGAMKLGRPVLVVDFGEETPAGNRMLLETGGTPVRTPGGLHDLLDGIRAGHSMKVETALF